MARGWRAVGARLASLKPQGSVLRGFAWGATLPLFVFALVLGSLFESPFGLAGDLLIGLALAAVLLGVTVLGLRLLQWLLPQARDFVGNLGLAGITVFASFAIPFFTPALGLPLALGLGATGAILGGSVAKLLELRRIEGPVARRWLPVLGIASAAGVALALALWLGGRGTTEHLIEVDDPTRERVPRLALPDPAEPGPHEVLSLTYGSGTDRRRAEFRDVAVTTTPVDASVLTEGYEDGWREKLRNWFWGFSPEEYPINGRVWLPAGEGPFPLVLIVHGNHNMGEFSDPGYGYLGEHLASRGMILVSVDENFLNGSAVGGVPTENDARGWMLLQHLAQWRRWQQDPPGTHPLAGVADLERIALIGHSRGGEAAAIAASFNRLRRYPDDATTELDFGFRIRGVIAIAPSDGQYLPADQRTPVTGTSYFTLQGGHDADVSLFLGDRQWNRVTIAPGSDQFKASLYVYRANHGQFNTVWGDRDFSRPLSWLLNRAPLLSGEEQRQIGKVFMTAFLEIVLVGRREYLPLFRDARSGRQWLPQDLYVSRFEDGHFRLLADFQEDIDVTTITVPGGRIESEGLALWREGDLELRHGTSRVDNAVVVGWHSEGDEAEGIPPASYTVRLPEGLARSWEWKGEDRLVFDLAALDEEVPEPDEEEGADDAGDEGDDEEASPLPIDLSVSLLFADGTELTTSLGEHRLLLPPLAMRFSRSGAIEKRYGSDAEPVLQTFEIPLTAFRTETGDVDPERWRAVEAIRFLFDRSPEAVIAIDRIGLWSSPSD